MGDDLSVDALRREFQDGMAGITARLDRLVSADVYTLQSAHTGERISALAQGLQREVEAREALESQIERYQLAEAERRERDRQARLYHATVPVIIGLIAAATALWGVMAK
ncbi:hypothetical protein [Streptomyces sp. UNOC14_S4]|uniref:hypothetical protein n=1 Tax=Streptomyces sp. UNOC14_S4 TaxID=2872340 RepID=UPI001E45C593|nr:hypothetical protein [Streptomyces sp. UNOC14_S4]MCC3769455.1 hypothetical protein [Streptomyces sp. UNOC14_S4]